MSDMTRRFVKNFNEIMHYRGLTIEDIGKRVGCKPSQVLKTLHKNGLQGIRLSTAIKLARALDSPLEAFLQPLANPLDLPRSSQYAKVSVEED